MSHAQGNVFTASFVTSALSTAGPHDLLTLLTSAASQATILELEVRPLSTNIAAAVEGLAVTLWRVLSTAIGGGAAVTPTLMRAGYAGAVAAVSAVTANSSSVLSTTAGQRVFTGAIGPDGYVFKPDACAIPVMENDAANRFQAQLATPSAAQAYAVTLTFGEPGRIPGR